MANDQKPVISVRKLRKVYMMGQEHVVALHNIDLDIQNRTILSLRTTFLPPLSKGGGLTAKHKLSLCCFLLAIYPPFLYYKLFCRQDRGIALHHQPFQIRTIPCPALNLPALEKRWGSVARSSRANYGGDCSPSAPSLRFSALSHENRQHPCL